MLAIAAAIEAREPERFKRCAVAFDGGRVKFWSPRNSVGHPGVVSLAEADALAAKIRAKLAWT